jgi:hypothetical protein
MQKMHTSTPGDASCTGLSQRATRNRQSPADRSAREAKLGRGCLSSNTTKRAIAPRRGCRSTGDIPGHGARLTPGQCSSASVHLMFRCFPAGRGVVSLMRPANCLKRPAKFPARRCRIACSSTTCEAQRENFPANREICHGNWPNGAGLVPERANSGATKPKYYSWGATLPEAAGLPKFGNFVTNPDISLTDRNVPIMLLHPL